MLKIIEIIAVIILTGSIYGFFSSGVAPKKIHGWQLLPVFDVEI